MRLYETADWRDIAVELGDRLRRGEVGVLPTDTLYGLSGDARNEAVVERILQIKARRTPMSIIPAGMNWAAAFAAPPVGLDFQTVMVRYRGPYTTLWPAAARAGLPAALVSNGRIGLRCPAHWVTELAALAGVPLVTTSVNVHGKPPMTSLDDLDTAVADVVDFLVYEGPRLGPASTLVICDGLEPRLQARA